MSRKTKEEANKTRTRILASALSLFAKKGYENTTFNDIAARLKLTKGAVYWHFESKEVLIVELMKEAIEKFRRQTEDAFPEGELSFSAVGRMMVTLASNLVEDAKAVAFFRLMKCQVKWTDNSMVAVRDKLLHHMQFGPKKIFERAIGEGIERGQVRKEVNADEVSTVAIALWDGIVQARIDHFLSCDMTATLEHAYNAIWQQIKI